VSLERVHYYLSLGRERTATKLSFPQYAKPQTGLTDQIEEAEETRCWIALLTQGPQGLQTDLNPVNAVSTGTRILALATKCKIEIIAG